MNDLDNMISQLERQRSAIDRAIAALREISGPGVTEPAVQMSNQGNPRKRYLSPESRRKMAEASKKRWAAKKAAEVTQQVRAQGKSAKSPDKAGARKRQLSPEGRKRIIEATKKRWAAKRAAEAG